MIGLIGAGLSVAGGMYGASKDKEMASRMKHAREQALASMRRQWKLAYEAQQNRWLGAREDVLGREQAGMGGVAASMAGSGLLGTTAAGNMARGVRMDTNRQLAELTRQQAAEDYGMRMDYMQLKGMTPYDNFQPQAQSGAWADFGALLGQGLASGVTEGGGFDWTKAFMGSPGGE